MPANTERICKRLVSHAPIGKIPSDLRAGYFSTNAGASENKLRLIGVSASNSSAVWAGVVCHGPQNTPIHNGAKCFLHIFKFRFDTSGGGCFYAAMNTTTKCLNIARKGIESRRQLRLVRGRFDKATVHLSCDLRDSALRTFDRIAKQHGKFASY